MTVTRNPAADAGVPPTMAADTPPAPSSLQGASSPRVMLWTLMIIYIFNFLDRQIVSILAEPIKRDFQLSDTQLGLMTGLPLRCSTRCWASRSRAMPIAAPPTVSR
jgi:hypothetical protein